MIEPLPEPTRFMAPSREEVAPQPLRNPTMTRNPAQEQMAAIPKKFNLNLQEAKEASPAELGHLRGLFTGKVRQKIARAKYYPGIARRRGMEGQPVISFTLNKKGRLTGIQLAQTSGYQLLDQAALEAVQQAEPYPEIPPELNTDTFQFKLPISFVLK